MSLYISVKRFFKNPVFIALFCVGYAVLCFKLYRDCIYANSLSAIDVNGFFSSVAHSSFSIKYVFIFFLFISYEYCKEIGSEKVSENLRGYGNSKLKLYFSHILVMSFFAVLTFIIYYVFNRVLFGKIASGFNITAPEFKPYLIKFFLIYVLLVLLSAICLGTLFSVAFKRIGAYISILITVMLTLATEVEDLAAIFVIAFGKNLFKVLDMFSIFPAGLNRRVFFWSAWAIGKYQYIKALILIAFSLTLIIIIVQSKKLNAKNTILKLACIAVCAVLVIEYETPQSKFIITYDHPESSTLSDVLSVGNNEYEPAAFKAEAYKMNLSFDHELSAEVEIKMSDIKSDELSFTLWKSYKVKEIKDGKGNPLEFTRDGNYLTLKNPSNNNTLVFNYKGHSNRFASNSDLVYLAGYFPYYPIAGKCFMLNPKIKTSFNDNSYKYKVKFDITADAKFELISNLDKTGENSFSGEAAEASLFHGFIDKSVIKGVTVIYPYSELSTMFRSSLSPQELNNNRWYKEVGETITRLLDYGLVKEGFTIICAPELNQQPGERFMLSTDTFYVPTMAALNLSDEDEIRNSLNEVERLYYD